MNIIAASRQSDFIEYLKDRKNSRRIPHRLEACGYTQIRNPDADDGLWRLRGRRQVIYARNNRSLADRLGAAKRL
jgi:isopentenyl diphosphate isomerase/L-lactate dehydrogenase-like FMN-dependent dehydrogenase